MLNAQNTSFLSWHRTQLIDQMSTKFNALAHSYFKNRGQPTALKIAPPESRTKLLSELNKGELLGATTDNKCVYLIDYIPNSSVIRELGRLRELSFRAVGEGSHRARDTDAYDKTYRHVVLWDNFDQEIVGAYRIGEAFKWKTCARVNKNHDSALYTAELFSFQSGFDEIMSHGVELGRSFIQPKYWSQRGLDMLWQGIGAYLAKHPQIRYLFGAVSISNTYPDLAQQEIVGLYKHFYQPKNADKLAIAKRPFISNRAILESFRTKSLTVAHADLRQSLGRQNVALPVLYKHYSDLCEVGGVRFIDFNIDPNFCFCVDGLIVADLEQMKFRKRKRYLGRYVNSDLDL